MKWTDVSCRWVPYRIFNVNDNNNNGASNNRRETEKKMLRASTWNVTLNDLEVTLRCVFYIKLMLIATGFTEFI